ncbi:Double-stranded RNA-binding protein 6 [Acorus gramineus]|uniref:Double-stranded RNA-binding protein 6 n=1 Tax=Acorus gramineus TaxID=55184 RepID=A0AAV9A935_ACOGR|nr:Double-stranded RNA-binding protein 6 [Acorus gramineus]
MYKNQLQELAQRSCFNLPSYTCIREGPDHAPRFKALVNFNGELFESPSFCTTLRQAEHSAAELALSSLSSRGPSHSLAARILDPYLFILTYLMNALQTVFTALKDETGVYKNLLQEIAQRVGAPLPLYKTFRSGLGHLPVFTCTVELAGIIFTGEPAKNKKQAEKNAAMAAWASLKQLAQKQAAAGSSNESEKPSNDELEQVTIARALLNYRLKEKMAMVNNPNAQPFPKVFPAQHDRRPSTFQPPASTGSKILPLIRPRSAPRIRPTSPAPSTNDVVHLVQSETRSGPRPQRFPAVGAAPYVPMQHFQQSPYHGMAPPVTMRTAVPVFSAPPHPPPSMCGLSPVRMAPPVQIRSAIPVFAAPSPAVPVQVKENIVPGQARESVAPVRVKEPPLPPPATEEVVQRDLDVIERLKQLEI